MGARVMINGTWYYLIQTELMVRGAPFNHHDTNTLKMVGEPVLNPWAKIVKERATDSPAKAD